ncbi:MAG: transglycosylase SLT domain-containing protein [Deltaproteobacteria bacterium]|nr:transglycosylase SLT domain-containing protein [Deltaproteobacteria bacterium]
MAIRSTALLALAIGLGAPSLARPDQSPTDAPALLALVAASPSDPGRAPEALREIAARLEGRDPQGALRLLEALPETLSASAAALFLRGEALRELGRPEEAVGAFEGSLQRDALLGDRLRLHLGEGLLELGRLGEAAAVLGDLDPQSPHHPEALLLRARALREGGRLDEARPLLEDALRRETVGRRAEALRLELSRAHLAAGDLDAARGMLEANVLHGSVAACREALEVLAALPAPDGDPTWQRLRRAERAGDAGLRALSRDERPTSSRPARWAAYLRARRAEAAGEAALAVALDGGVLDPGGEQRTEEGLRAAALIGLARGLTTLGRLGPARERWLQLAAEHPAHPEAPRARIAAAELSLRQDDFAEAGRALQAYLLLYPTDPGRPRAFFLWGWARLRQGEYAEAAELFAGALSRPALAADEADTLGGSRIAAAARARYWHARSLDLAGEAEAAADSYRQLLSRHPLSYYAALARDRQVEPALEPPSDIGASPDHGDLDPRVRRARQAAWLGLRKEARRQLGPLLATPSRARHPRDLLEAARTLEALGQRETARFLYRSAMVHDGGGLLPGEREQAMQHAFPRLHQDLIEKEARRWSIPPALVFGLILRESAFKPCARSSVGARGLMQLMGPAAADAAGDLGLAAPSADALCDPALNVRLGTWHLKKLLRRYEGAEVLAVAAYNAGAGTVDRWRERDPGMPLDVWVEEIPFDETRVYVRAVLSAARGYAWTWERPSTRGVGAGVGTRVTAAPQR